MQRNSKLKMVTHLGRRKSQKDLRKFYNRRHTRIHHHRRRFLWERRNIGVRRKYDRSPELCISLATIRRKPAVDIRNISGSLLSGGSNRINDNNWWNNASNGNFCLLLAFTRQPRRWSCLFAITWNRKRGREGSGPHQPASWSCFAPTADSGECHPGIA